MSSPPGYIVLDFTSTSQGAEGHRIYRSSEPMSEGNMPPPIAQLPASTDQYIDYDFAEEDATAENLYYRVSDYWRDQRRLSEEMSIPNPANVLYPDSPTWLFGDEEYGFANTLGLGTLFTDTAGTTPVVNYGDAIALAVNLADDGPDMVQSTAAARPVYGRMPITGVRNLVSNNVMTGAVVGNPGTLPLEWAVSGSSWVNTEVVALGEIGGVPYIDLRIYGTPANTGGVFINVMGSPLSYGAGDTFSVSMYSALLAGDVSDMSSFSLRIDDSTSATSLPLTSEIARAERAGVTATSNPRLYIRFNAGAGAIGVPQDFTIRLMGVQLEQGSAVTDLQLVDGQYNVTQPGIPSVNIAYSDTSDDNWAWNLAAGTYHLFIAGEKGCYFDEVTHAGGEFAVGPTTWTGGPTGAVTNLIGRRYVLLPVVLDRAFSDFEKEQLVAYAMARGCPGVWNLMQVSPNPGDPFTDTSGCVATNGAVLSVDSGDLKVEQGGTGYGAATTIPLVGGPYPIGTMFLADVQNESKTYVSSAQFRLGGNAINVNSGARVYSVLAASSSASVANVGFGGTDMVAGDYSLWSRVSIHLLTLEEVPA